MGLRMFCRTIVLPIMPLRRYSYFIQDRIRDSKAFQGSTWSIEIMSEQKHKVKRKLVLLYIEDSTQVECINLAAHLKPLYPNIQFMITWKKMDAISKAEVRQMLRSIEK